MLAAVAALMKHKLLEWKQRWVIDSTPTTQILSAKLPIEQPVFVTIDQSKPIQVSLHFMGGRTRVRLFDVVYCQKLDVGYRIKLECRKYFCDTKNIIH
jgi:hypothetical protein